MSFYKLYSGPGLIQRMKMGWLRLSFNGYVNSEFLSCLQCNNSSSSFCVLLVVSVFCPPWAGWAFHFMPVRGSAPLRLASLTLSPIWCLSGHSARQRKRRSYCTQIHSLFWDNDLTFCWESMATVCGKVVQKRQRLKQEEICMYKYIHNLI